jgi:hypothetical protein
MLLSCTRAGEELSLNKEQVKNLVEQGVLTNYGRNKRTMIHKDDLKAYNQLLNAEITHEDFDAIKKNTEKNYKESINKPLVGIYMRVGTKEQIATERES